MREIIEVDQDGENKCGMCQFRYSTLYRFEDEREEYAACAGCFLQYIDEEDIHVAGEDEIIISSIVAELVDHALAELSTADLDGLENTLHSIEEQIPQPESAA